MIIGVEGHEEPRGSISRGFQAKTGGGIRITMARITCPAACPLRGRRPGDADDVDGRGPCYAETGTVSWHWNRIDDGSRGVLWPELVSQVAAEPRGAWGRWAQAGDCPSIGVNRIDRDRMHELATAAIGLPLVGYTHYPVTDNSREAAWNVATLLSLKARGLNLNASCETLEQVDTAVDRGLTAVIVQHEDAPDSLVTPKGRKVVFCPAQRDDGKTTCFGGKGTRACGGGTPLCGRADRDWAVMFKAHGVRTGKLNQMFADGQLAKAA